MKQVMNNYPQLPAPAVTAINASPDLYSSEQMYTFADATVLQKYKVIPDLYWALDSGIEAIQKMIKEGEWGDAAVGHIQILKQLMNGLIWDE